MFWQGTVFYLISLSRLPPRKPFRGNANETKTMGGKSAVENLQKIPPKPIRKSRVQQQRDSFGQILSMNHSQIMSSPGVAKRFAGKGWNTPRNSLGIYMGIRNACWVVRQEYWSGTPLWLKFIRPCWIIAILISLPLNRPFGQNPKPSPRCDHLARRPKIQIGKNFFVMGLIRQKSNVDFRYGQKIQKKTI